METRNSHIKNLPKLNLFLALPIFVLFFLIEIQLGYSATYYNTAAGNWNANIWSTTGHWGANSGTYPGSGDNVIIGNVGDVTLNGGSYSCNTLNVEESKGLLLNGYNFTVNGDLNLKSQGYVNCGNANLTVLGNIPQNENNSYITFGNGNVTVSGNITYQYPGWGTNGIVCTGTGWLIMDGVSKTITINSNFSIAKFKQPTGGFTKAGANTFTISNIFDQNCGPTAPAGVSITVPANTLNSACATPTITVSQTTRTGFSYCAGSGPSSSQSYTVSGTNLSANITITAPTDYEVSTDNTNFYSSRTLTQSGGTVASTTIYVRLKSGLVVASYNSENVTHASTGATTQNVACSGTVNGPVITVSQATRTGFSYCQGSGPSSSQSYTVSGTCLTANITVTAPTNYEVSTDNTNFYSSRTLTQSGGTVASTTIYVRLKSGLTVASYNSENVTHASTGATTQNVACSGSVTALASVAFASASQVAAANIEQAAIKQPLSAFTFAVTTANTTISQINFTTTGSYTTSDISKFQLWYNTSNSLSGSVQIGSDITTSLGTGSHSFTGLSQSITAGTTGYFWITTDIQVSATTTHTIQVSAISTSDVTFICSSLSGSISAGGLQTIVAATRITYYSRATGNWNSNSTWSTIGCGNATPASSYPTATDNVIICNSYTVTANVDVLTTGQVTVNSGGVLTVNDNIEIDAPVTIATGGTMNWPTTIEIGANANIIVNGNISAGSTTINYQDAYVGTSNGKITATGTMAFSQLKSSASIKGGSLKASSITIGTYGQNEVGVDVAFEGPTTVSTYMGYGYTYFTNGNLTITNYNSNNASSVTENEFASNNSDLIFTNYVTAKNSSFQTNLSGGGDVYFNGGFENAYTGAQSSRLIADNVYIKTSIKGEGNTNLYIEANLVQQGDILINQNSNGNIYIKKNYDSNGYATNFNNTNATFKVEGNSRFDNLSGHLNSGGSIITLGNSYMKGTGTFGPNDGSIYVGQYLTIETLQVSFQGAAKGYIGGAYTAATFETGGVYDDANYNSDLTIGGSGFHPRNSSNNADATGGNYLSKKGGQITSAAMISTLVAGAAVLDVAPEGWSLPIELINFYAKQQEMGYVQLFWETASEINNDYFTILRSNDGITFEPIAQIAGSGNSSENTQYSYLDESLYSGITYYKLCQTDYDGKQSFSPIITYIPQKSNFEILKYYNTNKDNCTIELQFSDYDNSNNFMITNISGEVLFQQIFQNTSYEVLNIQLSPGIYIIINSTDKTTYKERIMVK